MNRKEKLGKNEYQNIHNWLRRIFGKANKCEGVKCQGTSNKFAWALRENCEYKRDRNSFMMLCNSCHSKLDLTEEGRRRMSLSHKNKPRSKETRTKIAQGLKGKRNSIKRVYQFDLSGKILTTFNSLVEAAQAFNGSPATISSCCSGRLRTTYGFKWSYEKQLPIYSRKSYPMQALESLKSKIKEGV